MLYVKVLLSKCYQITNGNGWHNQFTYKYQPTKGIWARVFKNLGEKKILKKRAWKVPWKEGSVFSISFQHCTLSHLNSAEVKRVCVWERERDRIVKKRREAMPEETTSIDYVMEAASGPHFSGLRLDGLRSSPPSSSTSSPAAHRSPVPASAFSSSSLSSALTDSNALKQPFVIGKFHFSTLKTHFHFFNFMN